MLEAAEDTALGRVQVSAARGQPLAWLDAVHRIASAALTPARCVLHMTATPGAPDEGVPWFIRYAARSAKVAGASVGFA
ncbi:hypothetical protein [Comamonas flocculans]|uniref:Uncharacterized protein n=1 Tax=Comamonas flocculans TaxID=2597701 RepID=A0A5B8RX34_9BURK|nr:hypothetical protein [Comamonas flocculans]QEA14121.1 hypothetical protein FOZ74_14405 [Comamonas flocculans]